MNLLATIHDYSLVINLNLLIQLGVGILEYRVSSTSNKFSNEHIDGISSLNKMETKDAPPSTCGFSYYLNTLLFNE